MPPLMSSRAAIAIGVLVLAPADALWAQQVPSPPGAIGGLFGGRRPQADPNRASSRWSITFSGSGGIDEEPVELAPAESAGQTVSGTAATISANSQFARGRTGRQIGVAAGGFFNRQELQTGQMRGADGRVHGQYDPTRRLSFAGSASINYQPMVVGAPLVIPGPDDTLPPESLGPPTGVDENLWISTMGTASVTRGWTPRQRFEASYTDYRSQPVDGPGLESRSRIASASEVWNASERFELRAGYNYNQTTQAGSGPVGMPTTIHSLTAGFDFQRRLGPTRRMTLVFDAGADSAETLQDQGATVRSVMPSASASAQFTTSERFTLSVGGGHRATVLPGITPTPFTTDYASLQIGGTVFERLTLSGFGSFSRGTAVAGQRGSYEAGNVTAQFNYGLSRRWGFFTTVSYYDHRMRDVSDESGIPPAYGRHTIRAGFSYWLPLYGTF